MSQSLLPAELLSLVHHVELNESGWWDKALQQVIVAGIWLNNEAMSIDDIINATRTNYSVAVAGDRLTTQVNELCELGVLVDLKDGLFKISEMSLKQFDQDLAVATENEREVKQLFLEQVARLCPDISDDDCWDLFNTDCLTPLVRGLGARTYELLGGLGEKSNTTSKDQNFSETIQPSSLSHFEQRFATFLIQKTMP